MRLLDLIIFNELVLLYYGPPELLVIPEHLGLEFSLMQYYILYVYEIRKVKIQIQCSSAVIAECLSYHYVADCYNIIIDRLTSLIKFSCE